jgi:lipase
MAAGVTLQTPLGRRVKVIERGTGTPVVFLHSGVGSAGEWKQVFSLWPEGYRLVAIEAYREGSGVSAAGRPSLDDYADQTDAVAEHVGAPVCLVGFSWGGATALRVAAAAPKLVDSLALIEPEAYALLRTQDVDAYTQICDLRDRWRAHVHAGRWHDAFEEFIDFYNGPGSFAQWAPPRREAFLAAQQARGDLWDALFDDDLLTLDALAAVTAPVHVIEGSETSAVDHAICTVVRRHVPDGRHTLIAGAGHMMPLTHPGPLTRTLLSGIGQAVRIDVSETATEPTVLATDWTWRLEPIGRLAQHREEPP